MAIKITQKNYEILKEFVETEQLAKRTIEEWSNYDFFKVVLAKMNELEEELYDIEEDISFNIIKSNILITHQ